MSLSSGLTQKTDQSVDWPKVLREHSVRFLALDVQADADLLQLFRIHPEWSVDTEDEEAVLLTRRPANHSSYNQTGTRGTAGLAA